MLELAIGIILGQMLGAQDTEGAKSASRKLVAFSLFVSFIVATAYFICAEFIPYSYDTTQEVRTLATRLMQITAFAMPLDALANASYFTLRSGGQVVVTFLFDSVFMWLVVLPISFLVAYGTGWDIHWIFAICQGTEILKCIFGYLLLRRGTWVRQLVSDQSLKETK